MKVVLIGKGRGWDGAPACGNGQEIWGITQLNLRRDVDLVIDMNDYTGNRWGAKESFEAAQSRNKAHHKEIPYVDLRTYPYDDISKDFDTDYFTSTIAYAIALAIFNGATEIDLYGVTMEVESEYHYQKPCVDFWCGVAKGRGIKVVSHGEHTTIMKSHDGKVYGYNIPQGAKDGISEWSKVYRAA